MNTTEFKNTICRICLDENVAFDWNNTLIEHDDVTYKDCYFKYTQIKQIDNDPFSSMLCETCSNSLENIHTLILKALDSYNFLLEVNCAKTDMEDSIIIEDEENGASTDFETVLVEKDETESAVPEQYEYESFDEALVKSEGDQFYKIEVADKYPYQETIEEVEDVQEEFDANQYIEKDEGEEDISKAYETISKNNKNHVSCKRKCKEDANSNNKTELKRAKTSFSRHKTAAKTIEIKYGSSDESSQMFDDYTNVNDLQYEEMSYIENEQEEYETDNGTEYELTGEDSSTSYETEKQSSTATTFSLNQDDSSNDYHNLKKPEISNSVHKRNTQTLDLGEKPNEYKTRKSDGAIKRKAKTKKGNRQNSQNTPSMCSYCSKILHNKYALQKHEKIHLENRERKAPCPICGVKFLEEAYVKMHMKIHNQDREKKHKCEFCDKAFYEKGSLNVHRRIHLGQMIPCTLCSKEFFRQVDLDIHMNSHSAAAINAETKKRSRYWVRCKYCNKDIMSTSFKYHTAVHLNEPQMRCSICDREFFRRDSCTEHLKMVHKKTTEEYNNFIILYNKNRLSHLYLEQTTDLKK